MYLAPNILLLAHRDPCPRESITPSTSPSTTLPAADPLQEIEGRPGRNPAFALPAKSSPKGISDSSIDLEIRYRSHDLGSAVDDRIQNPANFRGPGDGWRSWNGGVSEVSYRARSRQQRKADHGVAERLQRSASEHRSTSHGSV